LAANSGELMDRLRGGQVDVIFVPYERNVRMDGMRRINGAPQCELDQVGLMVRKDDTDRLKWFAEGVMKLRNSDDYERTCKDSQVAYGFDSSTCLEKK